MMARINAGININGILDSAASLVLPKAEAVNAVQDADVTERLKNLFRKFREDFRVSGGLLTEELLVSVPYMRVGDFVHGLRQELGSFPEFEDGRIHGWLDGVWMTFDMTAFFRRYGIEELASVFNGRKENEGLKELED